MPKVRLISHSKFFIHIGIAKKKENKVFTSFEQRNSMEKEVKLFHLFYNWDISEI